MRLSKVSLGWEFCFEVSDIFTLGLIKLVTLGLIKVVHFGTLFDLIFRNLKTPILDPNLDQCLQ